MCFGIIGMFRTIQDGFHFIRIQAGMLVLKYIILQTFIVVLFTDNDLISVHVDQVRSFTVTEIKTIAFFFQP